MPYTLAELDGVVQEMLIESDGDLEITVVEYEKVGDGISLVEPQILKIDKAMRFRVTAKVVMKNFPVLNMMLRPGPFKENQSSTAVLKEDSVKAMEILFKVFHNCVDQASCEADIEETWNLAAAIDKYGVDITDQRIRDWHKKWYESMEPILLHHQEPKKYLNCQELLFPSMAFENRRAFRKVTRYLVYRTDGQIVESNPSRHLNLHLDQRIMQQLNAARGRIRTILQRDLFKSMDCLLDKEDEPTCCVFTAYRYQSALHKIDVWPLEVIANRTDLATVFSRLREFQYNYAYDRLSTNCDCHQNYPRIVADARNEAENYFDGLCINCMKTDPKLVSEWSLDRDYNHYWETFKYSEGCKPHHGQPTWYFSFMARQHQHGAVI